MPFTPIFAATLFALLISRTGSKESLAERVTFLSADSKTILVGYLFRPTGASAVLAAMAATVPLSADHAGLTGRYSRLR